VTLCTFLTETYEPWMKATYRGSAAQVARIRAAFRDLLDLKLSDFTTGRIDRWRAARRNCHTLNRGLPEAENPRRVSLDREPRRLGTACRSGESRGMGHAVGHAAGQDQAQRRG
jgi:hypothetical protein